MFKKAIPLFAVMALTMPVLSMPNPVQAAPMTNQDWWPERLNLQALRQHSPESDVLNEKTLQNPLKMPSETVQNESLISRIRRFKREKWGDISF